jgi:teichuronic acid biosynthesis glycosyltransferase TuaC
LPGGLDLERFRPYEQAERLAARKELRFCPDDRVVLFAGLKEQPCKRLPLAEQAVQKTGDPRIRLVVPSGVPHAHMPVLMNAADVLLVTSVHEGSPTMVKEALACNLPVVSVDVGDVRERLCGVPGCDVTTGSSADELALALVRVLSRNDRIEGRQRVRELSERDVARRLVLIYRNLLARKPR